MEWRQIKGIDGFYEVSDTGLVRNANGALIGHKTKSGYWTVALREHGKIKNHRVHRLVLRAFGRARPPARAEGGLHWDGDKDNNVIGNLRWGTAKSNALDAKRHGTTLAGSKNPISKLNEDIVRTMRHRHKNGEIVADLAREYGISHSGAFNAIYRKSWKHVV